jgi:23S rRNA (pseudouridine1915-N3)-methyltransferase
MRLRVIAVGTRMPRWVDEVCADYVRRLGAKLPMELIEVATASRGARGDGARAIASEGERLLARVRTEDFVVALDEHGQELSTRALAQWLAQRMRDGRDVAFLIGGPDGHAAPVHARADFTWSLSQLTLPHALVRVLLAEQLYRAQCVLSGHPYHRE